MTGPATIVRPSKPVGHAGAGTPAVGYAEGGHPALERPVLDQRTAHPGEPPTAPRADGVKLAAQGLRPPARTR